MFWSCFVGVLCLSVVNSVPQLGGILGGLLGGSGNNGQNMQTEVTRLDNQNIYNTPRGPTAYYNNNYRQMPEYEVVVVHQPANRKIDKINALPLSQKSSYQPQPPPEDKSFNDYVAYEDKFPRGLPPGLAKKQPGYVPSNHGPPGHMPPGHNPNRGGPPGHNRPPMGPPPKGPNKHGPPPKDQPEYRPPYQDTNYGPSKEPTYGYPEPNRPMEHPRPPQDGQYHVPPIGQRPPQRPPHMQEGSTQNVEDKDKLIQLLTDIIGNRTTTSVPIIPNRVGVQLSTTASPYIMSFQAIAVTPEE